MTKKNLVVGAGISGAAIANLLANNCGENVTIIDKRTEIAGNCYDYRDENGIMVHKYGSHIFHTSSETVWAYIRQFTDFNQYKHKVYAVIDGKETIIPFNLNSLYDVFPANYAQKLENKLLEKFNYGSKVPVLEFLQQDDEDLRYLAEFVYDKIFLHYTKKQWGFMPDELDTAVTARVPVYIGRDTCYFHDKYQGIPVNGYSKMVENMLNHKNIEIKLNTDFSSIKGSMNEYNRIFFTGSIDEFFNYEFGVLPYRSVKFENEVYNKDFYQNNSVINYPNDNDFTRIHEYKYYLKDKSATTVIAREYPEAFEIGKNDRYYPIPQMENQKLYNKYLEKASSLSNTYFLGRLGDYKYYNMDRAILRALELFEKIKI